MRGRGSSGGADPTPTASTRRSFTSAPIASAHSAPARRKGPDGPVHGGGAIIRYESGDFGVAVEVDADGLVVSYPGLAYRR